MKFCKLFLLLPAVTGLLLTGCEGDPDDGEHVDGGANPTAINCNGYSAMYLLNEGGMGQNNARIDMLDFSTGTFTEDAFVKANPSTVLELGDVANDIKRHDQRLYVVLNGSHKVEVINAANLQRIGQVDISSPRTISFTDSHAYVTSYVDNGNDNGSVIEFDLETLQITRTISVGQEPEGIAIVGNNIYVAHSGGLHYPDYADYVLVIDRSTFSITETITVAPNLNRMIVDADGVIWVTSQGNYDDVPSCLYRIKNGIVESANVPCTNFAIADNTIYYYAHEWNNDAFAYTTTYGTLNRTTLDKGKSFISDNTETEITSPYGIFAAGGLTFITDAQNYASSGSLYIYDADGKCLNSYTTGILPSAAVFIPKD